MPDYLLYLLSSNNKHTFVELAGWAIYSFRQAFDVCVKVLAMSRHAHVLTYTIPSALQI